MTQPIKIATRKIGRNRGKPRLWIEGKLLIEAGLAHGSLWTMHKRADGFTLEADPLAGKRKVSGKPGRPVIDIAGASLGDLGEAVTVNLTYHPDGGKIVVTKAS